MWPVWHHEKRYESHTDALNVYLSTSHITAHQWLLSPPTYISLPKENKCMSIAFLLDSSHVSPKQPSYPSYFLCLFLVTFSIKHKLHDIVYKTFHDLVPITFCELRVVVKSARPSGQGSCWWVKRKGSLLSFYSLISPHTAFLVKSENFTFSWWSYKSTDCYLIWYLLTKNAFQLQITIL